MVCEEGYAAQRQKLSGCASRSAPTQCLAERRCHERKTRAPTAKDGYARELSVSNAVERKLSSVTYMSRCWRPVGRSKVAAAV
ncbi:MAG: hypothetical protein WKF90_10385 [Pyrinomonadaceae bacterium]